MTLKETIIAACPEILDLKFGCRLKLKKPQTNRGHFSDIPLDAELIYLNAVDLPGYDALGYWPDISQTLENGEEHHSGYLERGSWEILGCPIELHHVLRAIAFSKPPLMSMGVQAFVNQASGVKQFHFTMREKDSLEICFWNLRETLENQTEEVKAFLEKLLVRE